MNLALRMTRTRLLFLVLLIVALLVAALFLVHAALPDLWRVITYSPYILNRRL